MAKHSDVPVLTDPTSPRPFFSIITVCRNAESCIEVTAKSVLEQTCADWEWVVVDGASKDGTVAKIRELVGPDGRVNIQSESDTGIFNAMNKGVRRCRGRYVHFLNADDSYCDAGVLQAVKDEVQNNGEPSYLYGNIVVKFPDGRADWLEKAPPTSQALATMVCGCLPHQATFASRDLFVGYPGLFDESLRTAGDYKWMMQAIASPTVRLHHLDRSLANYTAGGASAQLESSLPESFRVINEADEFQEALGMKNILAAYQKQILALRVQHEKLTEAVHKIGRDSDRRRQEADRAKEKVAEVKALHEETKAKLKETKSKLEEYKAKVGRLRDRGADGAPGARKSWLRRLFRSR